MVSFEHFIRVTKAPVANTIGQTWNVVEASHIQCALACHNEKNCDMYEFDKHESICKMKIIVCGNANGQVMQNVYLKKTAGK